MNDAVRLSSRLVEQQSDHPPYRESPPRVADLLGERPAGSRTIKQGAWAYRQAAEDYAALCEALPGVALFEESLAITRMDYGNLLFKLGRVGEAEAELNQACAVLGGPDASPSRVPSLSRRVGLLLHEFGRTSAGPR